MLVGLVPKNLVDPIVNGEMLQIIFVAVIFGICINKLGDKVKILHDIIDAMNNFCLRMIMMIVSFIPFIAFLAMASLIFNIGLDSVFVLSKLVLGQMVGSFVRMTEIGKAESVNVSIHNRLGELSLRLEAEGEEYNPLVEVTDYDENDEDYYRTLILKANRSKMSYARKSNKNIVLIRVKDASNKQIYYTAAAMILGVVFGAILKTAATPELITLFNDTIAGSIETMFMNALNMMIAPVIFFSVISGITGLTNAADASRIGGKLIGLYSTTTAVAVIISLILAHLLFSTGVAQVGMVEGEVSTAKFSILSTIVGIIPKNLIEPIINRELLQIIFVAVIFGICLNKLGDKVNLLNDFIEAANIFSLKMIIMITAFIPLIAFTSMTTLIVTLGADSVFLLLKLIVGVLIGTMAMALVYCLLLTLIGKVSPMPYLKKLPSFIPIPLATSSSNVTMPFTVNCSRLKSRACPYHTRLYELRSSNVNTPS